MWAGAPLRLVCQTDAAPFHVLNSRAIVESSTIQHLADRGPELGEAKGLAQKRESFAADATPDEVAFGVTRHVQNSEPGLLLWQRSGERDAACPRQHDVSN